MKKLIGVMAGAAGAYLLAILPRIAGRPDSMPDVFYAHRGFHDNGTDAPENSLAAFKKAVSLGYGIELDVQLTKDGKVVVIHDFDLYRVCQLERAVDSCTYEELCQYSLFQSQEKIPLLKEVLEAVGGKVPLIVELKYKNKDSKICEKAQEILDDYQGTYCVESFHPQALLWYRKNRPHVCRGQLSMNYHKDDKKDGFWYHVPRHLLFNFLTAPDFIAYDHRAKKALSLLVCRKLYRCPCFAWTIRSQKQLDDAREYFDYFIFEGFVPDQDEE